MKTLKSLSLLTFFVAGLALATHPHPPKHAEPKHWHWSIHLANFNNKLKIEKLEEALNGKWDSIKDISILKAGRSYTDSDSLHYFYYHQVAMEGYSTVNQEKIRFSCKLTYLPPDHCYADTPATLWMKNCKSGPYEHEIKNIWMNAEELDVARRWTDISMCGGKMYMHSG